MERTKTQLHGMARLTDTVAVMVAAVVGGMLLLAFFGLYFMSRSVMPAWASLLSTLLAVAGATAAGLVLMRLAKNRLAAEDQSRLRAWVKKSQGEDRLCFALLAAFLLPRLLLAVVLPHELESDFHFYVSNATAYAETGVFPHSLYLRAHAPNAILFIWLMGSVFRLVGCSYYAAWGMDLVWAWATVLLFYSIARRFLSRRHSFTAALIYALLPSHVLYSALPSTEKVTMFTLLLGEWLALHATDRGRLPVKLLLAALSGACLAASGAVRPVAPLLLAGLVIAAPARSSDMAKGWRQVAVLAVIAAAYLLSAKLLDGFAAALVGGEKAGSSMGWALFEGLDATSGGAWSQQNSEVMHEVLNGYPISEMNGEFLKRLQVRLSGYSVGTWAGMFLHKNANMWIENSYAVAALNPLLNSGRLGTTVYGAVAGLLSAGHAVWMAMLGLSLLAWLRGGRQHLYPVVLHLTPVFCLMVWHSFGTSISRYHYVAVPFLLLLTFLVLQPAPDNSLTN